jgi:hypothetical protein
MLGMCIKLIILLEEREQYKEMYKGLLYVTVRTQIRQPARCVQI